MSKMARFHMLFAGREAIHCLIRSTILAEKDRLHGIDIAQR